jgi:hypothetical protein
MVNKSLFPNESPVAQRQPKTDRLILPAYLKAATEAKIDIIGPECAIPLASLLAIVQKQ